MTTVQEFYNGYNANYTSGNTFTINGALYVLVSLPGNAYVLMNTVTYASTARVFLKSPLGYDEIKELATPLVPDANGIIPTGAETNRRLPTGSIIAPLLPDQSLPELQLISIWDDVAKTGIYYFINTATGRVYSQTGVLTNNNGINTNRFADMNIGQPADWEIMRLGA